jgi:aryl-alcohol dehydrogenase-like predicted oxidoreductase
VITCGTELIQDNNLVRMNKLASGTVQFEMDYGNNNAKGKTPREKVFEMLNGALQFGIDTHDTAHWYGESESVKGGYVGR